MKKALCFDDVQILDGYSELCSRREVDLGVYDRESEEKLMSFPIFAAAMDTVVNPEMAAVLLRSFGGGVVHHRHDSWEDRLHKASLTQEKMSTYEKHLHGIAIGLSESPAVVVSDLPEYVNLLAIEVAAANNRHVFDQAEALIKAREESEKDFCIMVGNMSDACKWHREAESRGLLREIDFVKFSQGGGSACLTRQKTGIGKPTFQAVRDAYRYPHMPNIVADGGLRKGGDIVKSIGVGASAVMLGSMLAGHKENFVKSYRGMASRSAKEDAGMEVRNVEGKEVTNSFKGNLLTTLTDLRDSIQSGIATAGYESVEEFRGNADFVRVTRAGQIEATAHGDR